MHAHDVRQWTPPHLFHEGNAAGERGTRKVLWITLVAMVVEVLAGWWFNSMALLADGWHMSSHAVAIGLSVLAYTAARRYANDDRFAFGTWKIEVLGGFASALLLFAVAGLMVFGSVERLLSPLPIRFNEAIAVAVLGLFVNLLCARLLHSAGAHDHGHAHSHADHRHSHSDPSHEHHRHRHDSSNEHAKKLDKVEHDEHHTGQAGHHDLNLRSAYVHVLADAATSLLAILALVGGKYFAWIWLDPVIALVGAGMVGIWAVRLLKETASVLVDREMQAPIVDQVRALLRSADDIDLSDLHIWRVGRSKYACIMAVVTHRRDLTPDAVRALLHHLPELYHITVEINICPEDGVRGADALAV